MQALLNLVHRLFEDNILSWQADFAVLLDVTDLDFAHFSLEDGIECHHVVVADARLEERVDVVVVDWVTDLRVRDLQNRSLIQLAGTLYRILEGLREFDWFTEAWHVELKYADIVKDGCQL